MPSDINNYSYAYKLFTVAQWVWTTLEQVLEFVAVIPTGTIQISSGEGGQGLQTLTMTNATASGAIVQYAQGQEFFVPGFLSQLNCLLT